MGADDAATLDRAGGIAQVSTAALLVVIATKLEGAEVPPADVNMLGEVIPDQAPEIGIEMLETAYRQETDAVQGRLGELGLRGEVVRCEADAEEIVTIARDWAADLIVVGARHHGILDRLFGGDTAGAISRQADCDVLVVPTAE